MHGRLSRVLDGTKNIEVHSTVFTHLLYKAGLLSFTYVNTPSVFFNPHYTNLFLPPVTQRKHSLVSRTDTETLLPSETSELKITIKVCFSMGNLTLNSISKTNMCS